VLPSVVDTELSSGLDSGLLLKVQPEDIAAAVVRSVRTRAAEIAVPGYLGPLTALAPEAIMRRGRRLLKDDAAMGPGEDTAVRGRYLSRILDRE